MKKDNNWLLKQIKDRSVPAAMFMGNEPVMSGFILENLINQMIDEANSPEEPEEQPRYVVYFKIITEPFRQKLEIKAYFRTFDPKPDEPFNAIIGAGTEHAFHFDTEAQAKATAELIGGNVEKLELKPGFQTNKELNDPNLNGEINR